LPPLEPKLFSFNTLRRLPELRWARGAGLLRSAAGVLHPHLITGRRRGACVDRRNDHYFNLIQSLARHYGFDIETPWTELPEHVRHVLLHGSGAEVIEFSYREDAGAQIAQVTRSKGSCRT